MLDSRHESAQDISFYEELRRRKVPVSPVRPSKVICAHSYHAKVNISGGEFSGALRCGDPIDMDSAELLALLPLAQAAERRISAERSRDQSVGEKCGFRVSLSEKKEFLQCRGQVACLNASASASASALRGLVHIPAAEDC